ncbi:hypothetical protein [Kitasatospora sp. NPDC017646]|uniref:hypothetical protein n=1 Tax=Kitasatospora sp. NPDC017646 TaxID=3364024 RepID=UPI0037A2B5E1
MSATSDSSSRESKHSNEGRSCSKARLWSRYTPGWVHIRAIPADAVSYVAVAFLLHRLPAAGAGAAGFAAGAGADGFGNESGAANESGTARPSDPAGQGVRQGRRRNPALRDGPFLVVTALCSVLGLQFAVLEVGVPLWIVQQADAPRITVSGGLIVNTLMVIALQVRATRGTEERTAAARACRRAGLVLAASCVVIALAHGLPGFLAAVVVLVGIALQSLAEVMGQAGGWALSYDLAGEGEHGAYQGVFNAGTAAALMAGPAVVSTAVIGFGLAGWAVLGAVLAAACLAMGPAVRWAGRRDARLRAA